MTTEIERRVGNMLDSSQSRSGVPIKSSSEAFAQTGDRSSTNGNTSQSAYKSGIDSTKEKFSMELKEKQDRKKVCSLRSFELYMSLPESVMFLNLLHTEMFLNLPRFFDTLAQASDGLKAMQSFREKLPAFKMKSEFLKAVAENQVHCLSVLCILTHGTV